MRTGIEAIAAERAAHETREGWTAEHDDQWTKGELAEAAFAYTMHARDPSINRMLWRSRWPAWWPKTWDDEWFKPGRDDSIESRQRELEKAGSLIAAEWDRLERLRVRQGGAP